MTLRLNESLTQLSVVISGDWILNDPVDDLVDLCQIFECGIEDCKVFQVHSTLQLSLWPAGIVKLMNYLGNFLRSKNFINASSQQSGHLCTDNFHVELPVR